VSQIFTQFIAAPETESQIDSSGQPSAEPEVAHVVVQYPPGTVVSQVSASSQPLVAVQVPPTFGGSDPQAKMPMSAIERQVLLHMKLIISSR
jgi:hypothetical protein